MGIAGYLSRHLILNINDVRRAATQHGGQCTWNFSQTEDPVASIMGRSKSTSNGICSALAAQWILEESRGRTLRDYLSEGGGLSVAKVALVAQSHGADKNEGQEDAVHNRMMIGGMKQSGASVDHIGRPDGTDKADLDDVFDSIRRKGRASNAVFPILVMVSVAGLNKKPIGHIAHAMAISIQPINGAGTKYFDPNVGEFRFDRFDSFADWFRYYFKKANYERFMGGYFTLRFYHT